MAEICVIGTGMAGYGAAFALQKAGHSAMLFDKNPHFGGHTASFRYEDRYTFDEGPHISFTKNERIRKILADSIDHKYEVLNAKVNNYWKGHWIKHPAQVNLYGLPADLVVRVIKDYVTAKQNPPSEIVNYEQWLRASFGNAFAETFPMQYTLKFHTTAAANMSTDWMGPRLYQADLGEILRGALMPSTPDVHYIDAFRYPSHGGFGAYLQRFMSVADLRLNHEVVSIDTRRRVLRFRDGKVAEYAGLVSSVPLPDLIPMIVGAPGEVTDAASRLACSELVVVNLVVDRSDLVDAHWTYFYDDDIFFTRLSTPHMQSPNNVPAGYGSLQAECYFSRKYRPLDMQPDACIEPVIRDLRKARILREEDRIVFRNARHIPYANVIFDLERAAALRIVHDYLDEIDISYCGRYGDWAYIWTDESFVSGERAAQKILAKL